MIWPASSMRHFTWRAPAGPGPVVVDIPKDVQFAKGKYVGPQGIAVKTYEPR